METEQPNPEENGHDQDGSREEVSDGEQNRQPEVGNEVLPLSEQMVAALEQYAQRLPEALEEDINAGETHFTFEFRSNIRGHKLTRTRRGNLGRVIARQLADNRSISDRLKGGWQLVVPEEGSFVTVAFQDANGVNRIGRSDASNWVILQMLRLSGEIDVVTPEGIERSVGFYRGATT